jgi:hypothetical protein
LDREAKISHEVFSGQIEARLGYGEGDDAKGPDMRVWSKGRGLNDVRLLEPDALLYLMKFAGRLVVARVLLLSDNPVAVHQYWL